MDVLDWGGDHRSGSGSISWTIAIICTSIQTDNYVSSISHNFYSLDALPDT